MADQPHGRAHWIWLRLSSLPLIPLTLYFIYQSDSINTDSRALFVHWLQQPLAAAAVGLFILSSFVHACMGLEEIIIDYVPSDGAQKMSLALNKLFFLVLGAASLYAVVSIYSGRF